MLKKKKAHSLTYMSVFISEAEVWPRGRETETKKKNREAKGYQIPYFVRSLLIVCVWACGRGMTEKKLTSSNGSGNELTKHISGGKMKEG